jgi:hypothetical protein
MGETCAARQSVGTPPVSKDLLKMRHSTGEILCASSFNILEQNFMETKKMPHHA